MYWLKLPGVSKSATISEETGYPEYVVQREVISAYFSPPLPSSTFYDLVNKGTIVPFKHMRGFYLLNASLRRLGLKQVTKLPIPPARLRLEDIVRIAFCMIDRDLFPPPSCLLSVEVLESADLAHIFFWADKYRDEVMALDEPSVKIHYFQGALDAVALLETEA